MRRDGRGRNAHKGVPIASDAKVLTPDDLMVGNLPSSGPVVIYDDDLGYLAGVLAEQLALAKLDVTFVTPATMVSPFTDNTLEQSRVQARLIELGVQIVTTHTLSNLSATHAQLKCIYSGRTHDIPATTTVLVTERARNTALFDALQGSDHSFDHLELIGDALVPGLIADAVWTGHLAARSFERDPDAVDADWFRRETVDLSEETGT